MASTFDVGDSNIRIITDIELGGSQTAADGMDIVAVSVH